MRSIADAVAELTAIPRPVLCLDTCVFLDVITAGNRGQADLIEVNRKLSQILATTPDRAQLLVTSLVVREWVQRRDGVREEARKWLAETDRRIREIHRAWERLGNPLPHAASTYDAPQLVDDLTELAEALIRSAIILKEDAACVMRALHRVKRKQRPSHTKEIKDSIHFEHFLDVARRLRAAGYVPPRLFVSTNSADFWADKNTPQAHPELAQDLADADLIFFGRLPLALLHLGFLGAVAPGATAAPVVPPEA